MNDILQHSTKMNSFYYLQYTPKEATWKRKDRIVADEYASRSSRCRTHVQRDISFQKNAFYR